MEVAIAIGVSVGSALLTAALTPKPKVKRSFEDLSILKSEYGAAIPKVYGKTRITGNVIWGLDISKLKRDAGDRYYGDFAVLFCEGYLKGGIGKIWANNKLIVNLDTTDEKTLTRSNKLIEKHIEIYLGSQDQPPSATIQAAEGTNIPAFKGLCYLVFRNLPLKDYGNVIPKVEIEAKESATPVDLAELILDVTTSAGYLSPDEVDVSSLVGIEVNGTRLKKDGQSIREFIEDLQRIYQLTVSEDRGKLVFLPLVRPLENYAIPSEDLGSREIDDDLPDLFNETKTSNLSLPNKVTIEYPNSANNYNRGTQQILKTTAFHENNQTFDTACVLSDREARLIATQVLTYAWAQQYEYTQLFLPPSYLNNLKITPGSVLRLPLGERSAIVQIKEKLVGANNLIELTCISHDPVIPFVAEPAITTEYNTQDLLSFYGKPIVLPLDLPLLADTDEEYKIKVAVLLDAGDNPFGIDGVVSALSASGEVKDAGLIVDNNMITAGNLLSALPKSNPYVIDRSSKIRVVVAGELNSQTNLSFFNLDYIAWVDGELLSFQNARLIEPNTYELSNLIRGVRGTEHMIKNHPPQSPFLLVRGEGVLKTLDVGGVGAIAQPFNYKFEFYNAIGGDNSDSVPLVTEGNTNKPYSPCSPYLTRLANQDLMITWQRRTRKTGQWLTRSETVPLNQEAELYRLEILFKTTILKQIELTTNQYVYSNDEQRSDFDGELPAKLSFRLVQISPFVGDSAALEVFDLAPNKIEQK